MTNQEMDILFSCGLFTGIDGAAREQLFRCLNAEEVHFEKNEMIWHMDDPVHACAVVLSGAIRAEAVNLAGEHSLMAYHTPGALVGDILMATPGGTSPVYTIAAEPTTVVFLPFDQIMGGCERCCTAHARLRENLISEIAAKYWAQRRRINYLTCKSLRGRIAMYLLDCRTADHAVLSGTRDDLAAYLNVNRSALSRELSRMKEEGIIDFRKNHFLILDPELLAQLVP